ncbi:hypothetical protein [Cellulosimicrobium funkei]|uniref:hypothetical protein n=1 Tax=Cellulosimicrobium funkei TaxID=264251 RepID=UPI0036A714F3
MRIASGATLGAALILALSAAPAAAGGSDDPVPYRVEPDGLYLPVPDAFPDGGHVNIRYTVGGQERSAGVHFESLNNQPSGKFVGSSFLPWSYLIDAPDYCITWVQVGQYNEHFGEGGQDPVCTTEPATPTEPSEPSEPVEPTPPTEPTEPTPPTEPTEPSEPVEPAQPTEPSRPSEPVVPVQPENPSDPGAPTTTPVVEAPQASKPLKAESQTRGELAQTGSGPWALWAAAGTLAVGGALLGARRLLRHNA